MEAPERIKRLLVMNTGLGVGTSPGRGFEQWRAYAAANPDLDVAALMKRATPILSEHEARATNRRDQLVETGGVPAPRAAAGGGDHRLGEMLLAGSHADPDLQPAAAGEQGRDPSPPLGRIALVAPGGARVHVDVVSRLRHVAPAGELAGRELGGLDGETEAGEQRQSAVDRVPARAGDRPVDPDRARGRYGPHQAASAGRSGGGNVRG